MKVVIYKLYCKDPNIKDCYVGSTCDYKQRKRVHKSNCNNENTKKYNLKVYKFIRENSGFDNYDFEILEQFKCETKKERLERERYYISLNNTTLNTAVPGRTMKEYNKVHKEKKKQWHLDNREKRLKRMRQYNQDNREKIYQKYNCDCGGKYTHMHRLKHQRTKKHQKWYKTTYDYLKQKSKELDKLGLELDLKSQIFLK
jgi:hypothetical protein